MPVTVNQAASATAVTSSANPSFAGQSVTLHRQGNQSGTYPHRQCDLYFRIDNARYRRLERGSATYTTSSFTTAGTQTITVSYSGDANTQASSASLSQVVNAAFTLAPDGGGNTTLTVKAGQTVSAPINVTGAAGFSGDGYLCLLGSAGKCQLQLQSGNHQCVWHAAVPTLLTVNTAASSTASLLRQMGFGGYGTSPIAWDLLDWFCSGRYGAEELASGRC